MSAPLIMETDAFEDGGIVPPRYGCFDDNVQPGFRFRNVPAEAASLAEDGLHWASAGSVARDDGAALLRSMAPIECVTHVEARPRRATLASPHGAQMEQ